MFFRVNQPWLDALRRMYYGPEMRAKFIPELHQNHQFERENLQDIVAFRDWVNRGLRCIEQARQELHKYKEEFELFNAIIASDGLTIVNPNHPVIANGKSLSDDLDSIYQQLERTSKKLSANGYVVLEHIDALKLITFGKAKPLPNKFSYKDIFDKGPVSNHFMLNEFVSAYERVQSSLNKANLWLNDFIKNRNYKIIAGIAGTGKTHTIGYLIQEIDKQGDCTIFLNARSFDGNEVDFAQRLHNRLFIPEGYSLLDTLKRLNKFASKKGKRLFIIFDALNETTTSTLGFSTIWERELQNFINLLGEFPYLYFICTLRSSYIEDIWNVRPERIATLNGVTQNEETLQMCNRYFDYYKIKATNLDTADLTLFKIPLLLDLLCKMTNGNRSELQTITLDGRTYLQIFEGYVEQLVRDVQRRRNLMANTSINEGLHNCSGRFMQSIEATLPLGEFVRSFDQAGAMVVKHESIAQPMLEGNLVFIKERSAPRQEIVKHTQQLIGGYLLATYLIEAYPNAAQLIVSQEFTEMINGNDPALRHQLRLDIMKFLVIYRPEIITAITEKTAYQEGWWYLYNGYNGNQPQVPEQLLANPLSLQIWPYVMQISINRWLVPDHPYNIKFIVRFLSQFNAWDSDANWTFYIYENAETFFDLIEESLNRLKNSEVQEEPESVVVVLVTLLTATTIRELRDLATAYLIEYGKRLPLQLLEVAQSVATLKDSYVYQRAIHALYGVTLIKQHDQVFVQEHLPVIAETLFKLQFRADASHAVYDYIVIDSIKHLLDLAMYKGVWKATAEDLEYVSRYIVRNLPGWSVPSQDVKGKVAKSTEMDRPEPLGMDFAIYTIPRLIHKNGYKARTEAIANVLQRVFELGFKLRDNVPVWNEEFKNFYYGIRMSFEGKVDKLGKKYNWKAFYDYAGYLLQRGELDIYRTFGDPASGYDRLGDVEIDISMPNLQYTIAERFYFDELIPAGERVEGWQMEHKIETIEQHLIRDFNGISYVMLKGTVGQRIGHDYKTRSFIMTESCFIQKIGDFDRLKNHVCPQIFNWDGDLHLSPEYNSGVYFGEYYWADNQVENEIEHYQVKTGEKIVRKRMVRPSDIFHEDSIFTREDLNQEREFSFDEFINFNGEATLIQYLNESNSKSFKGFSMYIPTAKMGKHLGLNADPASGLILDENLQQCLITINYEQNLITNEATYIRADLLKGYMDTYGYALLLQNKQHSYDIDLEHNRIMKYAVVEL
ncbi:hypothetical protein ACLOAU_02300 [Niabella sp. CJ426]|uniref:hypothetical protein n=1 Tax=Niabella sp. CJ426 TaxID=3393740 RepID=UPI003D07455C